MPRAKASNGLPAMPEKAWQGQLLQLARLFKWSWWHDTATNAPRVCHRCKAPLRIPRNEPGWPDLLLVRDDTLIVAELKKDDGKLEPEQTAWLERFKAVRRIMVVVWRPRDHADVVRVLEG